MRFSQLPVLFVAIAATAPAQITQWNSNIVSSAYSINQQQKTVTILAEPSNPDEIFSFEAWSGGSAADIDTIIVDSGVGGTIRIQVSPDPNQPTHTRGAARVRVIDLAEADYGELVAADVVGDLGRIQFQPPGRVTVDAITGSVACGSLYNSCSAGNVSGSVSTGNLQSGSTFTAAALSGSLTASSGAVGDVTIHGDLDGLIDFSGAATYGGTITIEGAITGTGQITIPRLDGKIIVTGDLVASSTNRILVSGQLNHAGEYEAIHIGGSLTGSGGSAPLIKVTGEVRNTIGINGSMADATSGNEIEVASLRTASSLYGAIAINYDGAGVAEWSSGASIKVGSTTYTAPNAGVRLWDVSSCKGDFNSDGVVNSTDNSLLSTAENEANYYAAYPGLEGSRVYHGDCNFSGGFSTADPDNDDTALANLVAQECCATDEAQWCGGDINHDFTTDINDLALILSNFGRTDDPGRNRGDFDEDGDIDLSDLSTLLSAFGNRCCPNGGAPATGSVSISVDGYDTGYTGGGFYGEQSHFVFDVLMTITDSADDWTGSGVRVTTANNAALRLVPSPGNPPVPTSSTPNKYVTFFCQPYANVDGNYRFNSPFTSGGIAGAYSGFAGSYTYTTSTVDAAWYDMNASSNDGPAAVFRVVIDVSGVSGADTSGGFGSVYFTTGTPGSGDIKVADMTFEVEHKYDDSGATTLSGSFYVTD